MEVISEEIIEEDGQKYKVTKYDTGHIVKEGYSDEPLPDPVELLPELSDTESAIFETASNVEYLVALQELEL